MPSSATTKELNKVLADAIVFYQKLHQYHWVVKGKQFFALHSKFEELYDKWAEIIDEVAERILTIGGKPIPTLASALEAATIKEDSSEPLAEDMVKTVLQDLQSQVNSMREALNAAENSGDRGSANLMDGYCDEIEKTCWMLKSFLA